MSRGLNRRAGSGQCTKLIRTSGSAQFAVVFNPTLDSDDFFSSCWWINRDDLRQVKQRIEISIASKATRAGSRRKLHATSLAMCGRLGGRSALPFSEEEISLIAGASRWIPRLVNSICDSALLLAHAVGDSWITVDEVRQVLRDLDLTGSREEQCDSENEARPKTLLNLETTRPPHPGAPIMMRWASRLNLGTVQSKPSQRVEV